MLKILYVTAEQQSLLLLWEKIIENIRTSYLLKRDAVRFHSGHREIRFEHNVLSKQI